MNKYKLKELHVLPNGRYCPQCAAEIFYPNIPIDCFEAFDYIENDFWLSLDHGLQCLDDM